MKFETYLRAYEQTLLESFTYRLCGDEYQTKKRRRQAKKFRSYILSEANILAATVSAQKAIIDYNMKLSGWKVEPE